VAWYFDHFFFDMVADGTSFHGQWYTNHFFFHGPSWMLARTISRPLTIRTTKMGNIWDGDEHERPIRSHIPHNITIQSSGRTAHEKWDFSFVNYGNPCCSETMWL
jgi:hypothetical protein